MKRRALFGLAAAGMAALVGYRVWRSRDEDAVVDVLKKRLGYLRVDEAGMRRFAADFAAHRAVPTRRLRAVAALWPAYRFVPLRVGIPGSRHADLVEEHIASTFLMSTDFFSNGADTGAPVVYGRYYDAMNACSNPFRRTVST
jgi:hypothetical protein